MEGTGRDIGSDVVEREAERLRDEEPTGEEQVANSPRERRLELAVTILLSASALLSAWCAYQSTRLGSEESLANNRSSVLQLRAFRAEQQATQQSQADLGAFEQWLAATYAGDAARADFVRQRFSDSLATAFGAWSALDPLTDADAPASPLEMEQYVPPDGTTAARFDERAQQAEEQANEAGEAADNFVLAVVLLAAALFLLGIQTRIGVFELRLAMTVLAGALVAGTAIWVLTLPTSIGV